MLTLTPPAVSGLTVPATITYDEMGRKLSMTDPDKGTWTYTYNMLGELITQKDAKNQITYMAYDKLGNLTARTDSIKGFSETFTYDTLNRLTGTSADFGNSRLQTTAVTYNALGNILTKTGVGILPVRYQCGAGNRMHAVCQITAGGVGLTASTVTMPMA